MLNMSTFIITHSNRFAAAQSGAGPSDLVAFYTGIFGGFVSNDRYMVEKGRLINSSNAEISLLINNFIIRNLSPVFN